MNPFKNYDLWNGFKTTYNDTQYKLIEEDDRIVLIFQSTNGDNDLKTDFDWTPEIFKDIDGNTIIAHNGMYGTYEHFRKDVLYDIEKLPNKPLLILGWSLAGVYAGLMHNYIKQMLPIRQVITYTYGQPKTVLYAHRAFRERTDDIISIERYGDPITLAIPFFSRIGKVKRVGKFKLIPDIKYHNMVQEDF